MKKNRMLKAFKIGSNLILIKKGSFVISFLRTTTQNLKSIVQAYNVVQDNVFNQAANSHLLFSSLAK